MTQPSRRSALILILCVALHTLQARAKENVPDPISLNAPYDPRAESRMTEPADEQALKAFEAAWRGFGESVPRGRLSSGSAVEFFGALGLESR